ncbi:Ribosomal protein P1/P2 [Gracilaria domingensis]|nr:Ribosomal protein P1/P2 [Gracilaria domingensis]
MLAYLGGNTSPSSDDIKKILESAGVDIDEDVLSKVISQFQEKSIMDCMEEGKSKLASVPSGGAAPAGGAGAAEEAPKEEEQKEESEEEEEEEMDFDLFD